MLRPLIALLASLALLSCDLLAPEPEPEPEPEDQGSAGAMEDSQEHMGDHGQDALIADDPHHRLKYAVPFAWQSSHDEPLARSRDYLLEVLADNAANVQRGPKAFLGYADAQAPRATVITCSDSRVHTDAWDRTPENDDFLIRNIGNQIVQSHGSVEYGIEHLETPILLVLGHTGCGAVKAALGDRSKLSPAIRKELETLKLRTKVDHGDDDDDDDDDNVDNDVWLAGVLENVNQQVDFAVKHFGRPLREGKLTVLGGVYDFRNDLQGGAGKIHIINVNANTDEERLQAFAEALQAAAGSAPAPSGASGARVAAPVSPLARLRALHSAQSAQSAAAKPAPPKGH